MKKKIIGLVALFCFASLWAQSQNGDDSLRFCTPSNWSVLYGEPNLTVKSYQSDPCRGDRFLFDAPQQIFVLEFAPGHFRLAFAQDDKKQKTEKLAKINDAVAAVNGGFFVVHPEVRNAAETNDFLKIEGKTYNKTGNPGWARAAIAIGDDGKVSYANWDPSMSDGEWQSRFPNVMAAGPMLIFDGEKKFGYPSQNKAILDNDARYQIYAPRTAVGSKTDGKIVLIVIDGRSRRAYGATFEEMATIGKWLGLTDMINLDGGGSSTMIYRDRLINFPSDWGLIPVQRKVANAVLVVRR